MAEALFRYYRHKGKHNTVVDSCSAGINAHEDCGATDEVILLLEEEGIDVSFHRARKLTREMIKQADLILVMTADHEKAVREAAPEALDRIKLLKEFTGDVSNGKNITDPFGGSLQVYRETLQEIRTSVLKLIDKLENYFSEGGNA